MFESFFAREFAVVRTILLALVFAVSVAGCSVLRPDIGAPDYGSQAELAEAAARLRAAEQATVRIRNVGCGGIATGSGIVIGESVLLTNAHVVAGAETLEITLWDGKTVGAEIRDATVSSDLARVEVAVDLTQSADAVVATLGTSDPDPGEQLVVFGFPGGGRFTVLPGEALGYTDVDGVRGLVMSNQVVPGNSGGPVFDESGVVVGVVRLQLVESGDGVAIPITDVNASLAQMSEAGAGRVPGCDAFG